MKPDESSRPEMSSCLYFKFIISRSLIRTKKKLARSARSLYTMLCVQIAKPNAYHAGEINKPTVHTAPVC